jgi:glycosyltransferase involved in cell wall biosynthesis
VTNGVDIQRYPISPNYKTPRIKAFRRSPFPLLLFAVWCRSKAKGEFDLLIYNQWPLFHVALASASARRSALLDWCEVRHGFPYELLQRHLPRMTKWNMAVSPFVQKHISKLSGCPVDYIPSGIHGKYYRSRPRSERHSILYLGRITEHKNLPLLISSFEILKQKGYPGKLLIAGSGAALDALKECATESAATKFIDILGRVSDEEKINLLAEAELLAISSQREGFPRVMAEAMASGLPTVTVDYPENGTADMVRHYNCGAVSGPSPAQLADTILSILGSWESYSINATARAPELDWNNLIPRIEAIATSLRGIG